MFAENRLHLLRTSVYISIHFLLRASRSFLILHVALREKPQPSQLAVVSSYALRAAREIKSAQNMQRALEQGAC